MTGGADAPFAFSVTILLLGLAGIVGGLSHQHSVLHRGDPVINAAAMLFPAFVAFQLVPFPIGLLRIVSPVRAEVAGALSQLTGGGSFAPLTVAPPTTWFHLARITAYVVVFFVVRQLARRSRYGPWSVALPLAVIGTAEAAWAFATAGSDVPFAGTYPNRNHFAGLLEMTLPFALMYGVAVLYRSGRQGVLTLGAVVHAAVPLGFACVMFSAIAFSTSKSGVIACLLSLFFVAAVALGGGMSAAKRWTFVAGLIVLLVIVFVFLTPSDLVERFGSVASDQPSEGRIPIWRDTLHVIAAYPLFGCGLGAFFPTFLRYQFAGVGWAWTHTHNDYLQLLSELGIVGFLAPAVLMASVFGRVMGSATDQEVRDERFLGLACAGSLIALLVHSLTDYNTYVTANGLVVAWVAGIAAAVGRPVVSVAPKPLRVGRWGGPIVALLGLVVAMYGGGWLWFLQRHEGDVAAERRFCRFGICDTEQALEALRSKYRASSTADLPPEVLVTYLDRDRAAPYRWDDLAYAFNKAGRRDEARELFARAVTLGPTSASTLLMAADFAFDDGRAAAAFELISRALQAGDEQLYTATFALLESKNVPAAKATRAISMDRPTTTAYLRRLLSSPSFDLPAVRSVWAWAMERKYVDDAFAREYTNVLADRKEIRAAWEDWVRYAAPMEEGYPERNRIFNGGFERDSGGSRFDWSIQPPRGVSVTFDRESPHSGKRSLRIQFDGKENVGEIGVTQEIFLEPGRYVFRAQIRSQGVTTNEGVAFRISSGELRHVDVQTEAVQGTTVWRDLEVEFEAPKTGGMVMVRIARKPSLKFDNLVGGMVWVDDVSVRGLSLDADHGSSQ